MHSRTRFLRSTELPDCLWRKLSHTVRVEDSFVAVALSSNNYQITIKSFFGVLRLGDKSPRRLYVERDGDGRFTVLSFAVLVDGKAFGCRRGSGENSSRASVSGERMSAEAILCSSQPRLRRPNNEAPLTTWASSNRSRHTFLNRLNTQWVSLESGRPFFAKLCVRAWRTLRFCLSFTAYRKVRQGFHKARQAN
jgi:hypothetical protein